MVVSEQDGKKVLSDISPQEVNLISDGLARVSISKDWLMHARLRALRLHMQIEGIPDEN